MNESTEPLKEAADKKSHEATRALQSLAAEVELERVERGKSDVDPLVMSDERAMATEATFSSDRPNSAPPARDVREAGSRALTGRAVIGSAAIVGPVPGGEAKLRTL